MKSRNKLIAAVAALAIAAGIGFGLYLRNEAPQASFAALSGERFSTADLRGKVVLINFWATSCDVCVHEMPKMIETYNKYAPRGYEMVAVAMSYDHPNAVAAYAQVNRLPFKVALDADGQIARAFSEVSATPTTFLLDRKGRVLKQYLGEPDWAQFHALIERALADPA